MANDRVDDLTEMIKTESVKRANEYYEYSPGTDQCEVPPMTVKAVIPGLIAVGLMIILLLIGAFAIFPIYYPNY